MSEKLSAEMVERRFHLWFFRDLSDDQRAGLFRLCFHPVEVSPTHAAQQVALRHLFKTLGYRPSVPK